MHFSNYNWKSILNLVSSISKDLGNYTWYKECEYLSKNELSSFDNVVLLLIDWLWYNFLMNKKPNSFIARNTQSKLTSLFPATTPNVLTAIHTWLNVNQHGLTWRFVFLKEIWLISTILPFWSRAWHTPLEDLGVDYKDFLNFTTIYDNPRRKCYIFNYNYYLDTAFTKATMWAATLVWYDDWAGWLNKLDDIIKNRADEQKYAFFYLWDLDSQAHKHGINSKEISELYDQIDKKVESFVNNIKGNNTKVIITSDHGMICIIT